MLAPQSRLRFVQFTLMAALSCGMFGCVGHTSVEESGVLILPKKPGDYFAIRVVDGQTSRGIPRVRLTTIDGRRYYTDSAGLVAYFEPGWMNRRTWFNVESDGYSIAPGMFKEHGRAFDVKPGGHAVISLKRENLAQRLYRITGGGIYRDSVLLGDPVPIEHPLNNAGVVGQDSVQAAVYKGKLFWAWGDTSRASHPLAANFKTTCATSSLPGKGGLDPDVGINLHYFTRDGFVKPMLPTPGSHPYWISGLYVVKDKTGRERLLTNFAEIAKVMTAVSRGLAEFNDDKQQFQILFRDPMDEIIVPNGHPFRVSVAGTRYFYMLGDGLVRVKADYESLLARKSYEAYTCLKAGSRFDGSADQLDREPDGSIRYSWKRNTSPIGPRELEKLLKAGLIRKEDCWMRLENVDTGKPVAYHAGSIAWNAYRKRWTMIFCEMGGTSFLGEIWYAEAERPEGPWIYAKKIVTHKKYSFYNPLQHPFFEKDNGRIIYFEGTYTHTFSGNDVRTPRYDYNQVMYKLDLDDLRLGLPLKRHDPHLSKG